MVMVMVMVMTDGFPSQRASNIWWTLPWHDVIIHHTRTFDSSLHQEATCTFFMAMHILSVTTGESIHVKFIYEQGLLCTINLAAHLGSCIFVWQSRCLWWATIWQKTERHIRHALNPPARGTRRSSAKVVTLCRTGESVWAMAWGYLYSVDFFIGDQRYIWMFNFSTLTLHQQMKSFLWEVNYQLSNHPISSISLLHVYWPGEARGQGIRSCGINIVLFLFQHQKDSLIYWQGRRMMCIVLKHALF